jgi:hypothetical protein
MNDERTGCDPLILEGFCFKAPIHTIVARADDDNSV